MILAIPEAWTHARSLHLAYVKSVADEALGRTGAKALKSKLLVDLLRDNIDTIAIGLPSDLRTIIAEINRSFAGKKSGKAYAKLKSEAAEVLNYEKFARKTVTGWNAYELCKLSGASLCPYCQQAYAFTLLPRIGESGFRPTLDHFYSKSAFPVLGLSLFNLVPSCSICNSTLKRNANFFERPHLHPLEDTAAVAFDFDLDNYLLVRNTPAADFKLRPIVTAVGAREVDAANRSIRTFMLDSRYEFHSNDLRRFADLVLATKSGEMHERLKILGVFPNEATILSFDIDNFQHEMLGAIKKDIYDAIPST